MRENLVGMVFAERCAYMVCNKTKYALLIQVRAQRKKLPKATFAKTAAYLLS